MEHAPRTAELRLTIFDTLCPVDTPRTALPNQIPCPLWLIPPTQPCHPLALEAGKEGAR